MSSDSSQTLPKEDEMNATDKVENAGISIKLETNDSTNNTENTDMSDNTENVDISEKLKKVDLSTKTEKVSDPITQKSTKEPCMNSFWTRHCDTVTDIPVEGEVVGLLPPWLKGRLIRNGGGAKHVGEHYFNHLFDGMALLHMVNIQEGKVTYMSKYLESDTYKKNQKAQRIVVSEFGTLAMPDPCATLYSRFSAMFTPLLRVEATDNCVVNVMQVKDELLAMTETDFVRIVDPHTLETKPEKLQYSLYVSVHRATAHPHVDQDGTAYNLAFTTSGGPPGYAIVSMREGKIQNAKIEATIPARWKFHPAYMHSFGMTENYFIIIETPMCFNVLKLGLPGFTKATIYKALEYYPKEQTVFRVISRKDGKELTTKYLTAEFFNFHLLNCFEANGNVIVDAAVTSGGVIDSLSIDNLKKTENDKSKIRNVVESKRFVLPVDNIDTLQVEEELLKNVPEAKVSREDLLACASAVKKPNGDIFLKGVVLSDGFMELPRINYKYNTKPYKYAYGVQLSDMKHYPEFDGLIKINVCTGEKLVWEDPQYTTSEPIFVASPEAGDDEDDGIIMTLLLHKTDHQKLVFLILDAKTMTEQARVNFTAKGVVTSTFHGQFVQSGTEIHAY